MTPAIRDLWSTVQPILLLCFDFLWLYHLFLPIYLIHSLIMNSWPKYFRGLFINLCVFNFLWLDLLFKLLPFIYKINYLCQNKHLHFYACAHSVFIKNALLLCICRLQFLLIVSDRSLSVTDDTKSTHASFKRGENYCFVMIKSPQRAPGCWSGWIQDASYWHPESQGWIESLPCCLPSQAILLTPAAPSSHHYKTRCRWPSILLL